MKPSIVFLLACVLLGGCSTAGNLLKKTGQILMDPSIPVGAADDQPTRVALSLYANADVNPNPTSTAMLDDEGELAIFNEDGPLAVNITSTSRPELVASLHDLLDHLEMQDPTAPAGLARRWSSTTVPESSGHPFAIGRIFPGALLEPATEPVSVPAHWFLSQNPVLNLEPEVSVAADLELGQYRKHAGLDYMQAQPPEKAGAHSTPVAFRVLQLKDDSLLENSDMALVHLAPEKALGSTLISMDDYILAPGQFKFIEFSAIDEKTRYLAVIASFHDPNAARWYDVFRVESLGRTYALLVTLQDTRVAITDEQYRPQYSRQGSATQARSTP